MKLRRRSLLVGAIVGAAALALSACGGSGGSGGSGGGDAAQPKISIAKAADLSTCDPSNTTLKITYGPQGTPGVQYGMQQMQAKYPGIKFDATPSQSSSYNDLTNQVVADAAVGKQADLIMSGLGQLRFWVDSYHPAPISEDALPDGYQKQFLSAGTVNGQVYLAPFQISAPVLLVNQDLLKANGIDPTKPIASYADLEADAKAITAKTGKPSVNLSTDALPDWFAQGLVQSAGGSFVAANGQAGFGDDTGIKALGLWTDLAKDNVLLNIGLTDATAQFTAGNLPFMFATTSLVASAQKTIASKFNWMPVDMPTLDGTVKGDQPAGGNGWVVLSQDACKAAYANAMIGYMLSADGSLAASGTGFSYIPVNSGAATQLLSGSTATPQLKYAWSYSKPLSVWGGFKGSATAQIFSQLTTMTQQLSTGADTKSTVTAAVKSIDGILGS
jgi:multiple sugar transport system substrate-binding protein